MEKIKLFIDEYKTKYDDKVLSYYAGEICEDGDITNQQKGAEDTFSIGMPIYDESGAELGRLSIGLFENLTYNTPDIDIKIPVYTWRVDGYKSDIRKKIKTYYQINLTKI
jgi:hypothetical protein